MKKLMSIAAILAFSFAISVNAQEPKQEKNKKAKTEKSCSSAEKKSCGSEKKGGCCSSKKAKEKKAE